MRFSRIAPVALLATTMLASPALAQDEEAGAEESGPIEISANVALTTDYRFRGVSFSGEDIAIQGGFDVAHESGFYVGAWASSLEDSALYGNSELDIYAGWSGDVATGLSIDAGVLYYIYPTEDLGLDTDYIEPYASISANLGPAEATLGVAYAPEQDSLGGTDNLYVYSDIGVGIPNTPVTVTGHLGYTDGFLTFTNDGDAFDWSIGAEASVYGPFTLSAAYVGAEGDIAPGAYDFVDDAFVVTLSASF